MSILLADINNRKNLTSCIKDKNDEKKSKDSYDSQKMFLLYIWNEAVILFEKEKGKRAANHWIKNLEMIDWNAKKKIVIIKVPNQFTKEWIESHFLKIIEKILCRLLNEIKITIEFTIKSFGSKDFSSSKEGGKKGKNFLYKETGEVGEAPYFSSQFLITKSNELIISAIHYFLEKKTSWNTILFIYGETSTGKTHLLTEIVALFGKEKIRTFYIHGKSFVAEYINAAKTKSIDAFEKRIYENDIIIIDDIEYIRGKNYTQEFLLRIINFFKGEKKKIIISGKSHPQELTGISDNLSNIIKKGLAFQFYSMTREERRKILFLKIKKNKYTCSEEIVNYIVENDLITLADAESIIHKVMAETIILKKSLTLEYVASTIKKLYINKRYTCKTIHDVITVISSKMGIGEVEIKKNKTKASVKIKYLSIYILKKILKFPYQDIVSYFSYRDHTTLSYACKIFEKKYIQEKDIQKILSLFT